MTKTERTKRNEVIVRLAKRDIPVTKIAEAFGLSHQMIYNITNKAKQQEEASRLIVEAKKSATKQWIDKTIRENKRSHIRVTDVVKGIITQISRLYQGDDAIELIDYLETVISNVYTFEYCRNQTVVNYCAAKRDSSRKERTK